MKYHLIIYGLSYNNDVIRRLQDIADPIASVMLIAGFFLVMLGQKKKGLELTKWVALAYVAIQWVPAIMGFIKELARGV